MNKAQRKYLVQVSDHYKKRYRERIAKSSRIDMFATTAYYCGSSPLSVSDSRVRNYLEGKENEYGDSFVLRIYNGFVHVFNEADNIAITVYKLPKYNNRSKAIC